MKKTYDKAELQKKAEAAFKQYPFANEVFATADGNVFLLKNRASLHAGPKGKIYRFEREIETVKNDEGFNLDSMKKAELVEFAKINNIDLGGLTEKNTKNELLDAILKALEAPADETPVEESKTEETKVEETKVEETKVEETKVEETKVEETKTEETKTDNPQE